jgi:hypothetical protein
MSNALLTAVLRTLDLCVIERVLSEAPALRLLTPAPLWLAGVFDRVPPEVGQVLGAPIPFLDHFLPQAEVTWHAGDETIASSGPFTTTVEGDEVLLVATATCHHGRRLLILRHLTGDADLRPMLQTAREQVLELERLVSQIGALHAPFASIDREVKAMATASLPPELQALAERLNKSSADVQAVLATLPAPASRHRRQARTK